jgi:hypothetical protein
MTLDMKHCGGCNADKLLSDFYIRKSGLSVGKPHSWCIKCEKLNVKKWKKEHPIEVRESRRKWKKSNPDKVNNSTRNYRYRRGAKPASENKSCTLYLGCVIAETVISYEFPGFKRMPPGNPDYDYECPKGFTIDVKASCRLTYGNGNSSWQFHINGNKKAHFFLCIAWKDRETLVPEHLWLIPGSMVNNKKTLCITDSPKPLAKWSKYERSLKNVLECCNRMRRK